MSLRTLLQASSRLALVMCASAVLAADASRLPPLQTDADLSPVEWLEPSDAPARDLPVFRRLAPSDPRVAEAVRLIDNEAARFVRRLIASAQRLAAPDRPLRALPIVLQPGANHTRTGFYLADGAAMISFSDTPYVMLDLNAEALSLTLLHEGAHVVDRTVRGAQRDEATWSGVPHSTFAITDRVTALSEGFAIHLETLWGHYGADAERRSYYDRLDPVWAPDAALRGEFFAPVRDVLIFSQNWARYSAVRDTLPVFEGHVYGGGYLRSQYDPARDRARLKTANALVASEGAVASVLFWIVEGGAQAAGARPHAGLDQRGLLDAETRLVRALQSAGRDHRGRPVDLCDVVMAHGDPGSAARRDAIERFIGVTRGVTMSPAARRAWRSMYARAIALDVQAARKAVTDLDAVRAAAVQEALRDPARLRALVGPVLPIQLERHKLQLVAFGEPFAAEFDLNAAGAAELALLSDDPSVRAMIEAALDERPFESYADFEARTRLTLAALGAAPVR